MGGKEPITFMTDGAASIAGAVKTVLPRSFHGLCSFHICQNATKNLGAAATSKFFAKFHHLIEHVDTDVEFEYTWTRMLLTCFGGRQTHEVSWLKTIYPLREHWSSAWVKNHFTAGRKTTQMSEQLNAFARYFLKPEHTIKQFFSHFQEMLDELRYNELVADFKMENQIPNNKFEHSGIMVHAAKIYTPAMFELIHDEFEIGLAFVIQTDNNRLFTVQRRENVYDVSSALLEEETVEMDPDNFQVSCSCRLFENWWILCRHILRVMEAIGAFGNKFCQRIPDQYVMKRWTRDYKKRISMDDLFGPGRPTSNFGERYQRLCSIMISVGTRLCLSQDAFNFFIGKVIDAAKDAEHIFQFSSVSEEPTVEQCSFNVDASAGDEKEVIPKGFKKRRDPCKSKKRLMSEVEIKHLKKKHKRKHAIKLSFQKDSSPHIPSVSLG